MRKKKLILLSGLMVCAAALAIVSSGVIYTSSSGSCSICHEMYTYDLSWQRSSHFDTGCMECHSGQGVQGYVKAKWGGVMKTVSHFKGDFVIGKGDVSDPVCLKCHSDYDFTENFLERRFAEEPVLSKETLHGLHWKDNDTSCISCHTGLVHGSLNGGQAVSKETCDVCHLENGILQVDTEALKMSSFFGYR